MSTLFSKLVKARLHSGHLLIALSLMLISFTSNADVFINGPSQVCPGQTYLYVSLTTETSWCSYQWSAISQDGTIIQIGGQKDFFFAVPNEIGIVTIRCNLRYGISCNGFSTAAKSVYVGYSPPTFTSAPATMAFGTSALFSVSPAACVPDSYRWTVPNGWLVDGAAGPQVITSAETASITAPSGSWGTFPITVEGYYITPH